jgi:putative flippase GtrA
VGASAALSLFLLTWLFAALGLQPFVAGSGAYAITFIAAYTAQRNWTFGSGVPHRRALPRYLAVQAGCALLSGAFVQATMTVFSWPPPMASFVATVISSAASFVLCSVWAFGERPADRGFAEH